MFQLKGLQKKSWIGFQVFALLVILFPIVFSESFYITKATYAGIHAIIAVSLGLLMGFAGQISLGHAAFYGVGAYTTAVLSTTYQLNPWIGLIFSFIIPGVIAYMIGFTMARLSGYYLAMATLSFGIIIHVLLVEWKSLTKGASGLYGIPKIELFGLALTQGIQYYYFVWCFVLLMTILSLNIINSRIGRALRSIHGSEIAASSMGVDAGKYKIQIFVLGAMFSGLAGWLMAHMSYSISPTSFTLDASIIFLAMVVLGGSTSVWGAIIGSVLITIVGVIVDFLGEHIPFITSDFEHVIYGLILMLVVIFLPQGIFPAITKVYRSKIINIRKSRASENI
ncbi:branched-chain amino acid ABC transporter permease [Bacillus aquiflavi]|uniref:Branched-chain amino acid ABC transporter permease n=1 Tax=Bacillus aquiflavi TaxID=2672567 RepID=A0A6B3W1B2_9BACI|nr:branched-chain amino acid ABC transporter permease [Bacillus aquiflavi]MBA4537507.1 branched-chain amino acid ABC transporter permease [Bacillus aquiflavi]NEY81763.1 branched-chain amino acid ABC transporter permease [Bacillus aquiflavi]